SGFFVNFNKFYLYLFTYFQYTVHAFQSLPLYLRDVKEAVLARHKFHKGTEWHNGFHRAFIYFSYFWKCRYALDPADGVVHRLLIGCKNVHDAVVFCLLYDYCGASFFLDLLNDLTTWPDYRTNHIFADLHGK